MHVESFILATEGLVVTSGRLRYLLLLIGSTDHWEPGLTSAQSVRSNTMHGAGEFDGGYEFWPRCRLGGFCIQLWMQ